MAKRKNRTRKEDTASQLPFAAVVGLLCHILILLRLGVLCDLLVFLFQLFSSKIRSYSKFFTVC